MKDCWKLLRKIKRGSGIDPSISKDDWYTNFNDCLNENSDVHNLDIRQRCHYTSLNQSVCEGCGMCTEDTFCNLNEEISLKEVMIQSKH